MKIFFAKEKNSGFDPGFISAHSLTPLSSFCLMCVSEIFAFYSLVVAIVAVGAASHASGALYAYWRHLHVAIDVEPIVLAGQHHRSVVHERDVEALGVLDLGL